MTTLVSNFTVKSPHTRVENNALYSTYEYHTEEAVMRGDSLEVTPKVEKWEFKTELTKPKLGLLVVGLGGNNGTTLSAGLAANKRKLQWRTRTGVRTANYYGSLTQCATSPIGHDFVVKFGDLLPMVDPNEIVVSGWDISKMNMYDAMERAQVLEPTLIDQLTDFKQIVPMPGIFDISFVAPNQNTRADNVIAGTKKAQMEQIRKDIREFKAKNKLDKVIVLWSANTERYCVTQKGVHDTAANLLKAIEAGHAEISPSILYGVACILEGIPFINGSPQNTLVNGFIQLAVEKNVPIMGDDFKTGQTKFKSTVADFLVSSGLKLTSCASYNHLGNNDGKNLSFESCFKSKEISKASVIDDIVAGNPVLYPAGDHPDHIVVIKYVPSVGDSKKALDEYESEIFLGGKNTIAVHNTCEDSLLAAPLMIDLVLLMEIFTRIEVKSPTMKEFHHMHAVASMLSFLLKAPQVPPGTPVVNALFKQRCCLENILRACRGLHPIHNMTLEYKTPELEMKFKEYKD